MAAYTFRLETNPVLCFCNVAVCVQAVFNDVKGDECIFLWRAIGAALVSLVSVTSYSLKVGAALGPPALVRLPQ